MFQFRWFPSSRMTEFEPCRVSPFGHLRLLRFYTPHRSFSQYNTSFIGTRCLGIHYAPFVTFRNLWYGVADFIGFAFSCITYWFDYLIVNLHLLDSSNFRVCLPDCIDYMLLTSNQHKPIKKPDFFFESSFIWLHRTLTNRAGLSYHLYFFRFLCNFNLKWLLFSTTLSYC